MAEKSERPLENMDQKAVNEYLEQVLQGKLKLQGLEARTLVMFKAARARLGNIENEIGKLAKRMDELHAARHQLHGEASGYASMLAFAEDERRGQKSKSRAKRGGK